MRSPSHFKNAFNSGPVAAHAMNSTRKFAFFDSDYDVDAQSKKDRD
jgi:hypothetical protein